MQLLGLFLPFLPHGSSLLQGFPSFILLQVPGPHLVCCYKGERHMHPNAQMTSAKNINIFYSKTKLTLTTIQSAVRKYCHKPDDHSSVTVDVPLPI
ncbi:unnamed protein product [Ixodes pacificus]